MSHRPRARTAALLALVLAIGVAAAADRGPRAAGPGGSVWAGRAPTPEGVRRVRQAAQALQPRGLKLSQLAVLQQRAAPDALQLLVVGCDFADSLLWGRDPAQFPGWPPQSRQGHYLGPLLAFEGRAVFEFTAHDSAYFDIQMQRVRDYFATVSRGRFTLTWDVLPTLVNLPRPMGYYGDDDTSSVRVVEMARDVIAQVDPEADFSRYDTLVLIHAGAGQETDILQDSPAQLFSNYLDARDFEHAHRLGALAEPRLATSDGVDVAHVLVLPESESQDPIAGISDGFFGTLGVYCFELGLRLGMLNLADFTPQGFPDSQGAGQFDLMSYGLFSGLGLVPSEPSAINRVLMGWVDPVTVAPDLGETLAVAAGAVESSPSDTLIVKVPIDSRQYWLAEYRLQDPDGNLRFSFPGDLNGDGFPDYYDADSDSASGFPTTPFTPGRDTWENTTDAEWDFDMSEWLDGPRYRRGRGSGLYIWHVDERVIEDAVRAGRNAVNSDRAHKGVDLEEADGIQDLDDPQPSVYFLGWDGDAFRGGGADHFDPSTNPSTETADGAPTGISLHGIGAAVLDSLKSPEGGLVGLVYAPAIPLRVARAAVGPPPARERARVRLDAHGPAYDVRLADLSSADGPGLQIIAAGDSGLVYAWHGDLGEWTDGDADPATPGVLARARGAAGAPQWLGPPAVGDIDGDGELEVVLAAADALYAFRGATGAELRDGDSNPATVGVLLDLGGARPLHAPLLFPLAVPAEGAPPSAPVGIALLVADGVQTRVARVAADGAGGFTLEFSSAFPGLAITPPTLLAGATSPTLAFAYRGAGTEGIAFALGSAPDEWRSLTDAQAAAFPLLSYRFAPGMEAGAVAWVDSIGRARAARVDESAGADWVSAGAAAGDGPWSPVIGGPDHVGGAPLLSFTTRGSLRLLDRNLRARTGSPYTPPYHGEQAAGGTSLAAPLLVDVDGDGAVDLLWHDPVGRLHALDRTGRPLPGWPLAGPAEPAGSPAVGDVDGDGLLELVAVGGFDALQGTRPSQSQVETRRVGEVRVYDLSAPATAFAPWPQGRGDAWNTGMQRANDSGAGIPATGAVFVPASLVVYPSPAIGGTVRVRAELRRSGRVEGWLYNLEGQQVRTLPFLQVDGGGAYDEEISIEGLAGGYYVCRLRAEGEAIFRSFVVAR